MILLLGRSGYVGSAFAQLFERVGVPYMGLSRSQVDYTDRDAFIAFLRETRPAFVINAAGYTGKPNVDVCEERKADCLLGNAVLPALIREACAEFSISWGHVSSGCIFEGTRSDGLGFRETDAPNFCFRTNNCSFYSGCKAIGEECLSGAEQVYIWRLRIPFNSVDSPRNYLSKIMRYPRLLDATNSLSHLDEFVEACWLTWQKRAPFGIYNVTNPGSVTTREVVDIVKRVLKPQRDFQFFHDEQDFMRSGVRAPRSNCVLDASKILSVGIELTPVDEAIKQSLQNWQSA